MRSMMVLARHSVKALIRKKDFYVFFLLLLVMLAFLLSENFFGIGDISRYIKDVGYFCLWLFSFIIAVTFSAKQLPEEFDSKTVYPLLAKPVSRAHLLIGRFLGSLLASSLAFSLFYVFYCCIASLRGEGIAVSLMIQSYMLGVCFMGLTCAISILLSLLFTYSAAIAFSFILYFAVVWFTDALRIMTISSHGIGSVFMNVIYYIIPHYEFYDMRIRLAHAWEPLPPWAFFAIVAYTLVYVLIALFISYGRLKKRVF